MAFTYLIEKRSDYLAIIFSGDFDGSSVPSFMDSVIKACISERPEKMLLDCRQLTGDLGTLDRFRLGLGFSEKFKETLALEGIPNCRFATLGNPPLVQTTGLSATVSSNRGIDVRSFNDPLEALVWLDVKRTIL